MSAPKIELIISASTTWGTLDLYPDEQILLNLSIANIKDITVKNSPFSQTFYIPGTANNNQILTSIFEIGIDSVFDARKKAQAQLLVNNIPVTSHGFIQLTNIDITNRNEPVYQIVIFDQTKTFFDSIDGKYLTNLNFSELSHTFTVTAITDSWSASTTPPYYYGLSDFGYNWSLNDVNGTNNSGVGVYPEQMFPSTQVKYIWDKIFSAAGYSYTSNFLESDKFKGLYIPYNSSSDALQDNSFCTARTFFAQLTADTIVGSSPYPNNQYNGNWGIHFQNDFSNGNFDNGNLYDAPGTFDPAWGNVTGGPLIVSINNWTADTPMSVQFNAQVKVDNGGTKKYGFGTIPSSGNFVCLFHRSSLASAAGTSVFGTFPLTIYNDVFARIDNNMPFSGGTTLFTSPPLDQPTSSTLYPARAGEVFWITFEYGLAEDALQSGPLLKEYSAGTFFYNTVLPTRVYGQLVPYNNYIPQNITQSDFVNSICKMHNLYIEQDKDNENNLIIEPRDYYYATGVIKDWSQKLDTSQKITQQLLSEQQKKTLRFSYTSDSDYANQHYLKAVGQNYGDFVNIFNNDFTTDEEKISVIFSPTPSKNIINTGDFVVPFIAKENSLGNYGQTNFNIRILQKNQTWNFGTGSTPGVANGLVPLLESWKLSGKTYNYYPYLGHLNTPGVVADDTYDINWGNVSFLYYDVPTGLTTNNLVNTYWYNTLQEINDKNSYMMTCYMYLTPTDINNLKYNDIIFVDGVTQDGGCYYKINSIEYNVTSYLPSKVELIKSLNQLVTTGGSRSSSITGGLHTTGVHIGHRYGNTTHGNSVSFSNGTFLGGDSNSISVNSDGSIVTGFQNNISSLSPNSVILGGSGNTVIGANNVLIGVYDVTLNSLTSVTSNQTYITNVNVLSSITIGNVVFTASGSSALGLWTGSTGTNSIIANNGTGNLASGINSFVAGQSNSAISFSQSSTIAGGEFNVINGGASFIGGGTNNYITGSGSFIGGGAGNSGLTPYATIAGGKGNTSIGYSFVGGGIGNLAKAYSFIGAGKSNTGNSAYSTVLNGRFNLIQPTSINATILGGNSNLAYGFYSLVGNGHLNSATSYTSLVVNGAYNIASGQYSSIVQGAQNQASGQLSFIGNGFLNSATTLLSTVVNGKQNLSSAYASFIGGGTGNTISSVGSSVVGGFINTINSKNNNSVISGGRNNTISTATTSLSRYSFIGAGQGNSIIDSAYSSSIVGGGFSIISGSSNAFIGGGFNNSIINSNTYLSSVVVGGSLNKVLGGGYSTIVGGAQNIQSGCSFSFNGGGYQNFIKFGQGQVIVGGGKNSISGLTTVTSPNYCFIGGGSLNSITGATLNSSVLCGTQNLIKNGASFSSILAGSGITAISGQTAYVPDLAIQAQKGIYIGTGGTNPTTGLVKLLAGSATVTTNKVTAASLIFLTVEGGILTSVGNPYISSRTPGTSFVITSTNVLDASNIGWWIVEPF